MGEIESKHMIIEMAGHQQYSFGDCRQFDGNGEFHHMQGIFRMRWLHDRVQGIVQVTQLGVGAFRCLDDSECSREAAQHALFFSFVDSVRTPLSFVFRLFERRARKERDESDRERGERRDTRGEKEERERRERERGERTDTRGEKEERERDERERAERTAN